MVGRLTNASCEDVVASTDVFSAVTRPDGAGSADSTLDGRPFGRVSVIIANYNYEKYVAAAIDSALALDWPDVEVIVVDDGSTDDSRRVIREFGDRVIRIEQDNATQRVARNRGFARSSGDVVIHLDSDDVLKPELIREVAAVWRPGVSKVQVQMERIDERGDSLGSVFPHFPSPPTAEELRLWATQTSAHPTPPGSGNVYARWFLDELFPLDDSCGPATDSACLALAPLLGDVVTIARPLVLYRVHSSNTSDLVADDARFPRAVERARQRHLYATGFRRAGRPVDEAPLRRSRGLLQLRVASLRLKPDERPLPEDSRARVVWDAVRSPSHPGPEPHVARLTVAFWVLATALAPTGIARRLIRMRFQWRRG